MGVSTDVPPPSWWQRASKTQAIIAAILFAIFIFALLFGFDLVSQSYQGLRVPMLIVDGCIAVLFGALILKIIRDSQIRHRALLQRLEMIAEMNHHIRNALDEIQLSAHTTHNAQLIQNIQLAMARIQWALREVLPQSSQEPKNE